MKREEEEESEEEEDDEEVVEDLHDGDSADAMAVDDELAALPAASDVDMREPADVALVAAPVGIDEEERRWPATPLKSAHTLAHGTQ